MCLNLLTKHMNWRMKSCIQRICDAVPGGHRLYYTIQRSFGALRQYDYLYRLREQRNIAGNLMEHGVIIEDAVLFEVGTGWVPIIPTGFWFLGTRKIHTFDLNSYLSLKDFSQTLNWISENEESMVELYNCLLSPEQVRDKLKIVRSLKDRPLEFLNKAEILYKAPGDATGTGLPDNSIDLHISISVFEHIPINTLEDILIEANRILKPGGRALHIIDTTDHFSHNDRSIPYIHFLKFSSKEWRRIAGSRFAFCNRLFESDYIKLFENSPLKLTGRWSVLDKRSMESLEQGFPLAEEFRGRDFEDLARRDLWFLAEPG